VSRARAAASAALLVVAMTLAGCAADVPMPLPTPSETFAATGDGSLRIGTLFPLVGPLAGQGQAQAAGVELAVREINAAGGVAEAPVEVFHRNASDAASVTAAFASLVERGVDVVVGPESTELVQLIAADAEAAGVLIISTSIATPVAEEPTSGAPMVVGLQPAGSAQGAELGRLLAGEGAARVALVSIAMETDVGLSEPLAAALDAADSRLAVATVVAPGETDFSRLLAAVDKSRADAILLTAPVGASADVAAVVTRLADAGYSGDELWFSTEATVAFTGLVDPAVLEGANGLGVGAVLPAAFVAALATSDPGLSTTALSGEAHDAVVLAALAATVGGDDGGATIGRQLSTVSSGGIPCRSFAECLQVLTTESDVDFAGVSGALDLTGDGAVSTGSYARMVFTAEGIPVPVAE